MKKLKVAILFGGKSAEHDVSIQSARNVFRALNKKKYDVDILGIDKAGIWHKLPDSLLLQASFEKPLVISHDIEKTLIPYTKLHSDYDVIFPVLHGPYGEDGSMQGFLKILDIPFVGSGVLGSAVGMDKDVAKRLLKEAGLPVGKFISATKQTVLPFTEATKTLGTPLFVKPANMGSSIGVVKVKTEVEYTNALETAFTYDTKILIEEYIPCVEIECSVLGNDEPIASIPGEIVANHEFYSYEAKYLDEHGATLKIPAALPREKIEEMQTLAIKAFQTLCLEGLARVDCFYTADKKFYINEVNTMPGFTNISMYPKLWEYSGISNEELVDRLITLALERYTKQKALQSTI